MTFRIAFPVVSAIIFLMPALSFAQSSSKQSVPVGQGQNLVSPAIKPDTKKAKVAYRQGLQAEQQQDWQAAFEAYTNAVNWAPNEQNYYLRLELAKSRVVQSKAEAAERDAVAGRMDDARRELLEARYLDPSNTVLRDRLAELSAAQTGRSCKAQRNRALRGKFNWIINPERGSSIIEGIHREPTKRRGGNSA